LPRARKKAKRSVVKQQHRADWKLYIFPSLFAFLYSICIYFYIYIYYYYFLNLKNSKSIIIQTKKTAIYFKNISQDFTDRIFI